MKANIKELTDQLIERSSIMIHRNVADYLIDFALRLDGGYHFYLSDQEIERYDSMCITHQKQVQEEINSWLRENYNYEKNVIRVTSYVREVSDDTITDIVMTCLAMNGVICEQDLILWNLDAMLAGDGETTYTATVSLNDEIRERKSFSITCSDKNRSEAFRAKDEYFPSHDYGSVSEVRESILESIFNPSTSDLCAWYEGVTNKLGKER